MMAVPEARKGAIMASQPTCGARSAMKANSFGSDTKNTPTAKSPVGPAPSVKVAAMVPTAAGSRRRVAIERSKDAQVTMTPRATIGSGRVPLLYGSQNAKNMKAAVQCATRRLFTKSPKRGRISRERMNQTMNAEMSAGRRTNIDVLEISDKKATRS